MKAIAVGALVGFFLAGIVAPTVTHMLPPRLRGPAVVWSSALVVVSATALSFGLVSRHRRN